MIQPDSFNLKTSCLILLFVAYNITNCTIDKPKTQQKYKKLETTYFINQKQPEPKLEKTKYEYFNQDGQALRWLEVDTNNNLLLDYIYEYAENNILISALYKEESDTSYYQEKFSYPDDSTMITEWLDSAGTVYYTMIDNLNKAGKTKRASFGNQDEIHGYDTTYYDDLGFVSRIFFTNKKGKVLNDRSFQYVELDNYNNWVLRSKVMNDTIVESQHKQINYDSYVCKENIYYPGIISSFNESENMASLDETGSSIFFTRASDWNDQIPFYGKKINGSFVQCNALLSFEKVYNGAISPAGDQIIYAVKEHSKEHIYISKLENETWGNPTSLSESSDIYASYFSWVNDTIILAHHSNNNGDIIRLKLKENNLSIQDNLDDLNTNATEFAACMLNDTSIIFTRYKENDINQQGFFISTKQESHEEYDSWSTPIKINKMEYGWGAHVISNSNRLIYSDGEDIKSIELDSLEF